MNLGPVFLKLLWFQLELQTSSIELYVYDLIYSVYLLLYYVSSIYISFQ